MSDLDAALYAREVERLTRDLAAARRQLEEARGLLERWKRCEVQPNGVAAALDAETERFLAPPAAPPPCASWCGTIGVPKSGKDCVHRPGSNACYCTPACRDAGAPRNPEKLCETCEGERIVYGACDVEGCPRLIPHMATRPCPTCTPGAK